jgi:N utilization substance protein A
MEDAIQRAARARYGAENDIAPSSIRPPAISACGASSRWSEQVDDYFKQVSLEDSQKLQPGAEVGDFIVDPLPPIEFGRIAAQAAKQVIFQKVRDAERERQYESSRTASARSSPASSSASNSATSSSISAAPKASSAATSRSRAKVVRVGDRVRSLILSVRRENRGRRSSSAARIRLHEEAVRAGSARNLRRHHRDQGRRARSGQPRQDRRHQPRQLDRSRSAPASA